MAGTANLVRYPGMPTSGRYVYHYGFHHWQWQCDLCGAPDEASTRKYSSQLEAFLDAMKHAEVCTEEYEEEK